MECSNLMTCSFVKTYQNDPVVSIGVKGYITSYCKGDKESSCLRKKISQQLGKDKVPTNMMPSGRPVPNTKSMDWQDNLFPILKEAGVHIVKV
ncbi:MAG: hypothetical protein DKM50_07825 [Candidatus Margulisiibacteriota bacterium]|nr:MAG: hypothetical protein A2X43_05270 [Candidatus Margulisbacteria bacterium GWD2_39_127]OGI02622.1 MAG: hypothetical protein A2X42_10970 [Candidatus Margulisbacteria bacterium GWF2_38_17]OGI07020.1 MAG: hypothetical protein A2X41_11730 [Candidatus Margulisbacteria bacterium GWE2_39_32]PZM79734.1 MAG: hypothetical protein DKM50_07825 [Candidatus Margulisiibacteriota bacterium]HAR63599.1 hypothetical protein [Candidatus Margulisiibacteriota bacterium]